MQRGKEIAGKILKEGWQTFDPENMADYDALFPEKGDPAFLNIWAKKNGQNFGYVVIHHFLERVGVDQTFVTTAFTGSGEHLFKRLVTEGVLEEKANTGDLAYPRRFEVKKDPKKNLEEFVHSANRPLFALVSPAAAVPKA